MLRQGGEFALLGQIAVDEHEGVEDAAGAMVATTTTTTLVRAVVGVCLLWPIPLFSPS